MYMENICQNHIMNLHRWVFNQKTQILMVMFINILKKYNAQSKLKENVWVLLYILKMKGSSIILSRKISCRNHSANN